ncbi:MAG TPA: DUF1990 family protein, partial [Bacteroidia bacterium]
NISIIKLTTTKTFEQLDLSFFFNYNIFPDNILIFETQWNLENRKMKEGDTIVQQVYIPPVKTISQKLIFGVRIKEIINEPNKKGFSYETLEGHVEKGISVFTVEQENSELIFKIHTWSAPGNLLAQMLGPVFSRPYQRFCTKKALQYGKMQIERQ